MDRVRVARGGSLSTLHRREAMAEKTRRNHLPEAGRHHHEFSQLCPRSMERQATVYPDVIHRWKVYWYTDEYLCSLVSCMDQEDVTFSRNSL